MYLLVKANTSNCPTIVPVGGYSTEAAAQAAMRASVTAAFEENVPDYREYRLDFETECIYFKTDPECSVWSYSIRCDAMSATLWLRDEPAIHWQIINLSEQLDVSGCPKIKGGKS